MRLLMPAGIVLILLMLAAAMAEAADGPRPATQPQLIDWDRARQLHQRAQKGEKLSPEEQAYYDRAKALRQEAPIAPKPVASTGLVPLTDAGGDYKGFSLGLYGDGHNTAPDAHAKAAQAAASAVIPLDRDGRPAPDGKVVLLSIGMSNTTQEFASFVALANADARKSAKVVIVDAAQGGRAADSWSSAERMDTWQEATGRLARHDVTPQQVQVLWVKQARIAPAQLGAFPKHAQALENDLKRIVAIAREQFPNLKLVYLSSRTYGGWAKGNLNPEPYAYQSAFSV